MTLVDLKPILQEGLQTIESLMQMDKSVFKTVERHKPGESSNERFTPCMQKKSYKL
jgi:hypothetical protein